MSEAAKMCATCGNWRRTRGRMKRDGQPAGVCMPILWDALSIIESGEDPDATYEAAETGERWGWVCTGYEEREEFAAELYGE